MLMKAMKFTCQCLTDLSYVELQLILRAQEYYKFTNDETQQELAKFTSTNNKAKLH